MTSQSALLSFLLICFSSHDGSAFPVPKVTRWNQPRRAVGEKCSRQSSIFDQFTLGQSSGDEDEVDGKPIPTPPQANPSPQLLQNEKEDARKSRDKSLQPSIISSMLKLVANLGYATALTVMKEVNKPDKRATAKEKSIIGIGQNQKENDGHGPPPVDHMPFLRENPTNVVNGPEIAAVDESEIAAMDEPETATAAHTEETLDMNALDDAADKNGFVQLFIGNLNYGTSPEMFEQFFEHNARVPLLDCAMPHLRGSGRNKGYCFVTVESKDAPTVIQRLTDGRTLDGRALRVEVVQPKFSDSDEPSNNQTGGVMNDTAVSAEGRGRGTEVVSDDISRNISKENSQKAQTLATLQWRYNIILDEIERLKGDENLIDDADALSFINEEAPKALARLKESMDRIEKEIKGDKFVLEPDARAISSSDEVTRSMRCEISSARALLSARKEISRGLVDVKTLVGASMSRTMKFELSNARMLLFSSQRTESIHNDEPINEAEKNQRALLVARLSQENRRRVSKQKEVETKRVEQQRKGEANQRSLLSAHLSLQLVERASKLAEKAEQEMAALSEEKKEAESRQRALLLFRLTLETAQRAAKVVRGAKRVSTVMRVRSTRKETLSPANTLKYENSEAKARLNGKNAIAKVVPTTATRYAGGATISETAKAELSEAQFRLQTRARPPQIPTTLKCDRSEAQMRLYAKTMVLDPVPVPVPAATASEDGASILSQTAKAELSEAKFLLQTRTRPPQIPSTLKLERSEAQTRLYRKKLIAMGSPLEPVDTSLDNMGSTSKEQFFPSSMMALTAARFRLQSRDTVARTGQQAEWAGVPTASLEYSRAAGSGSFIRPTVSVPRSRTGDYDISTGRARLYSRISHHREPKTRQRMEAHEILAAAFSKGGETGTEAAEKVDRFDTSVPPVTDVNPHSTQFSEEANLDIDDASEQRSETSKVHLFDTSDGRLRLLARNTLPGHDGELRKEGTGGAPEEEKALSARIEKLSSGPRSERDAEANNTPNLLSDLLSRIQCGQEFDPEDPDEATKGLKAREFVVDKGPELLSTRLARNQKIHQQTEPSGESSLEAIEEAEQSEDSSLSSEAPSSDSDPQVPGDELHRPTERFDPFVANENDANKHPPRANEQRRKPSVRVIGEFSDDYSDFSI